MCLFKRNRDKKKKYKITFQKIMFDFQGSLLHGTHKVISDTSILKTLYKVKEQYDFEIISIEIQEVYYTSQIIIKCKKEDKNLIFFEFCSLLDNCIESVSIK